MPERRRFNTTERVALYLAADGRCEACGEPLQPGWHADHVQQVIDGDLSPNAAAITAGIRKAYARYRTDDPALAVAALLRHYTPEQIREALP